MLQLSNRIVTEIFPEEERRVLRWLRTQKRNLRNWLVALLAVIGYVFVSNIQAIIPFLALNFQLVFDTVLVVWIGVLVALPFLWPQKPGDMFTEDFKRGLNPRVWEYEGGWKVELDEDGHSVLTVTDSNLGGLALPCLSWADFELQFDTRIIAGNTGWIIRASSLNDYVHQKLDTVRLATLYRVEGLLPTVGSIEHSLPIHEKQWFSVRLLARGNWLSTYMKLKGKEHLIFQDQALGVKPPAQVEVRSEEKYPHPFAATTIVTPSFRTGSFGFRLHVKDKAQYRNLRAYRLGR